jgi:hypothetical protein
MAGLERLIKAKLATRDQSGAAGETVTADMRFAALAQQWLEDIKIDPCLSDGTTAVYKSELRTLVLPTFEHFALREISTARAERFLTAQPVVLREGQALESDSELADALRPTALLCRPPSRRTTETLGWALSTLYGDGGPQSARPRQRRLPPDRMAWWRTGLRAEKVDSANTFVLGMSRLRRDCPGTPLRRRGLVLSPKLFD